MRVADLFCGCGGLSIGFQTAGHEIVLAADSWSRARLAYDANFDLASSRLNLSDVIEGAHAVSQKSPDIIVGGPPCQDFSAAGLRTEAENADLTLAFTEIVRTFQPLWFLMENVPAAVSSRAWAIARRRFSNDGYGLTELTLDASFYGVPQIRKRVFMIGRVGEEDGFLDADILLRKTDIPLTVREYLGDEFGVEFYYRHPRHWDRRAIYSVDEPAATVRSTNRPIPPKYKSHPRDKAPIEGVKPLTCYQRARLQTFQREFVFDKSLVATEVDTMVANAVPARLAQVLAECITDYEVMLEMSCEKVFRTWLRETQSYTDRSAGNVVSRLNRVRRLIGPVSRFNDTLDAVHALEKASEFSAFSSSVKSQLKRAIYLHSLFLGAIGVEPHLRPPVQE
jgi:DNA (cytosine-5)-methyltransferase 1